MAHFAKIGKGNIVTKVEVVHNDIATTEQAGIDFLKEIHKDPTGIYVQTSYNNNFREKFASVDGIYDTENDRFLPPKQFPSWSFNEAKYRYEPPTARPADLDKNYQWNEATLEWREIT